MGTIWFTMSRNYFFILVKMKCVFWISHSNENLEYVYDALLSLSTERDHKFETPA